MWAASAYRSARSPAGGNSMPAASASSRSHPAPRPASNRPADTVCICSAAWANSTGERNRLLAKAGVSSTRAVAAANVASVTQRWG